jgi:hypothetical protein
MPAQRQGLVRTRLPPPHQSVRIEALLFRALSGLVRARFRMRLLRRCFLPSGLALGFCLVLLRRAFALQRVVARNRARGFFRLCP